MTVSENGQRPARKRRKGQLLYYGSDTGEPPDTIKLPEAFSLTTPPTPAQEEEHKPPATQDS